MIMLGLWLKFELEKNNLNQLALAGFYLAGALFFHNNIIALD